MPLEPGTTLGSYSVTAKIRQKFAWLTRLSMKVPQELAKAAWARCIAHETPSSTGTMSKSLDDLPTRAEQDQAEAVQLYRLAAEQGVAGAQCRLGVAYAEGSGVPQDDKESVRWFRLAAAQGEVEAQGGLGLAYGVGRGVPQDFVASHMWMTIAAARLTGVAQHGAMKFRDTIAAAMTSKQIAEAQRLAKDWKPILDP